MTEFLPVTSTPSLDRQRYSHAFKRQIVEESLLSGASIAGVALSYGVNANLLHKWRWRYRRGEYGAVSDPSSLLPVKITAPARMALAKASQPTHSSQTTSIASGTGHIELFVKETRVLIHGAPDRQTLRNVIDALRT
jgi:transposase